MSLIDCSLESLHRPNLSVHKSIALYLSCSTVSLVLRTSLAQLGASGAGRCEERTSTPSEMKWRQEVTVWWVGARQPSPFFHLFRPSLCIQLTQSHPHTRMQMHPCMCVRRYIHVYTLTDGRPVREVSLVSIGK